MSIRVLRRFPYLEGQLSRIAVHVLSRLHLAGPDGESTIIESDGAAALMIRRVEFDELLVSLAVAAGAEVVTGADIVQASSDRDRVVLVARDGRRFEAPVVIAADGVHSTIARRMGLNHGWPAASIALDMMEETPREALEAVDPSTLWVTYGYQPRGKASGSHSKRAPEGYAYIFPKRDHVNVGVGYVLSYYRDAVGESPYQVQRCFVDELRSLGVVSGNSVRENFTPFLIPVGGPLRRPGRGRVLLAGDAGGFVNAFTAEGIYYAMVSGELAARAVVESGGGGGTGERNVARRYRRLCNREIGPELRDAVLIQQYLFADRRRIARTIDAVHRYPALTGLALDYVMGRRSYRAVRRRLVGGSPRLAFGMAVEILKSFGPVRRQTGG